MLTLPTHPWVSVYPARRKTYPTNTTCRRKFMICDLQTQSQQTMKTVKTKLFLLALLSAFSLQPLVLRAQGSLAPPGAPAPTMKTLDQIEARTPVDATHTPGDSGDLFVIAYQIGRASCRERS